jgi:hypothetical protein
MRHPIMLIVAAGICATPALAPAKSIADESSIASMEKLGSWPSRGLVFAQAQAPGGPVTADQAARPAPQTPVKDRVAPTVPPPPPSNTPAPRSGSVAAPRG